MAKKSTLNVTYTAGVLFLYSLVICLSLAINNLFLTIRQDIVETHFQGKNQIFVDIVFISIVTSFIIGGLWIVSKFVKPVSIEKLLT